MKMWKLKITPAVFKHQYLSFYLAKMQNQGQFWNPQNQQISKLTLLLKFGWEEPEKIEVKRTRGVISSFHIFKQF